MSIFRDRIVLSDGTVIMPENIDRVEVVGRGRSTIVSYDVERKNTYSVIAEEGMFRTDRPTGMVDSTGEAIFERDRVVMDGKTGVVKFSDAAFDVVWDEQISWGNEDGLWTVNARLTIIGMVPWEDER